MSDHIDSFRRELWGAIILMAVMTVICVVGFIIAVVDGSWALGIVASAGTFSSVALGLLCVDDLRNVRFTKDFTRPPIK